MNKLTLLSASALALLAFTATTQAQTIVSVQFPSYYSTPYNALNGSTGGGNTPTVTAGEVPAANWNDALGNSNLAGGYQNTPNTFTGGNGSYTTDITNNNLFTWILNPTPGGAYPNNGKYTSSPTTLVDSTGAASDVFFDVSANASGTERGNGNQATLTGGNNELVSGGAFNYGTGNSTSLSLGVDTSTDVYNLYVYLNFDYYSVATYPNGYVGNTNTISGIGSTTYYVLSGNQSTLTSLTAVPSTATSAANAITADYIEFTGLTTSQLNADTLTIAGGGGFSGFQLVDTGAPVVPEPSTYVLLGLGFCALVVLRRRTVKA